MKINNKTKKGIKILSITILCASAFFFTQCTTHKAAFKGMSLEKSQANTNFSQQKLDSVTNYLKDHAETTGMVILQNGKMVYEYGDIQEVSYIASCRKSVLSMLYGKHIENGTIDLDETIGELGIDDNDALLPKEKEATVRDIITSRSGVFHRPANGGYDENNILERGSVEPGEYFVYNNWDFNVAGHILEQKTGNTVYEEIEQQLAIPLGFEDWNIKNQKRKVSKGKSQYSAYHIYISTRDMAKIGQLMLNEGKWNGEQIISKEWIKQSTSVVTPVNVVNERYWRDETSDLQLSYGYMWWLFEEFMGIEDFEGAYTASGYGGQYITVIPKRNIVIAHKSKLNTLELWGLKSGGVSDHQYYKIVEKIVHAAQ